MTENPERKHSHAADHDDGGAPHSHLPPDPALRVKALETLLVGKGLVDPAALDELIETYYTRIGQRNGAKVSGPSPLPTERNLYCVIRAPHVNKDSREHFEMKTHKRLIDILEPNPKVVDSLMRLDLPAGVDIEIKL